MSNIVATTFRIPLTPEYAAISVATAAELEALPDSTVEDGTLAYVATYRDTFRLDKVSTAPLVADVTLSTQSGVGHWHRTIHPSPSWMNAGPFYIGPTGTGEASGTSPLAPTTLEEVCRRILPQLSNAPTSTPITCYLMGDLTGPRYIYATAPDVGPQTPSIFFNGSKALTPLASGTLTATTPVSLGNALTSTAGSPWTVTCPGFSWAPHVGRLAHVTAGPRAGTQFRILEDLGGGVAAIGQPALLNDYSFDEATLVGDEPFTVYRYPHLGDTLVVAGSAGMSFEQIDAGLNGLHDVTLVGPGIAFFDSCTLSNFDAQGMQEARATGCAVRGAIRGYASSTMRMWNTDAFATSTLHEGSLLDISDATFMGASLQGGEAHCSVYVNVGWLAFLNAPSPALHLTPGTTFTSIGGGRVFGTGCPAPRMLVPPGRTAWYPPGFPPNIVGSGAGDVSLGGITVAFSALPQANAATLCGVVTTPE